MQTFLQDLKHSFRRMAKEPGFTLAAVLTLALGIGTNTAIFSAVHGVLLQALPYANGDGLVHIGHRDPAPGVSSVFFSAQEMQEYRQRNKTLASVEEYHSMSFTLLGQGEPDRIRTGVVSTTFFDNFGVKPLIGRTFVPVDGEPGAEPVLVLSFPYWQRHFLGDTGIVGKTVVFDGKPATVVGVLPQIPLFPDENDAFVPPQACSIRASDYAMSNRKARMLNLFGRLKPGTTSEQAYAELAAIIGAWRREDSDLYPDERYHDVPVVPVQEELTAHFRPTLLILLATVGLVLLLACLNVANLALTRIRRREREVAMRSALGASRGRLVAQLLTESTALALVGGALGIALAFSGLGLLTAFASQFTPRASEITIDGPVLLFTLSLSLLTGILFGSFPAFQASARQAAGALKAGGRFTAGVVGRRIRALLTISQVAISFMLLIGAGLAIRSFLNIRQVQTGFDPDNVVTMKISLPSSLSTKAEIISAFEALLARVRALPGVIAVGMAGDLPLEDDGFSPLFEIEGRTLPTGQEARANFDIANEGFFRTLRIPLLRGRLFTSADTEDVRPVMIINESFARQYWTGEDPVGRRVALRYRGRSDDWLTIVGVFKDVKQLGLNVESGPAFYLAFHQMAGNEMRLFVRTVKDPLRMVPSIVKAVHERDPDIPVGDIRSMAQILDKSLTPSRLTAVLLTLLAALACAIAVLGISGVVSSSVNERTHEIGIRSALGARRGSLLGTVLWQGMTPVFIGLALGLLGALGLTRFLSSILFGVVPNDVLTYLAVAFLLLAVSVLACLVPARHAMAIDPLLALRYE